MNGLRWAVLLSGLWLSGCLDFDEALKRCGEPGGRCSMDGGLSDGGAGLIDAGSDAGQPAVDAGQPIDAGGAFDAGTPTDGGPDGGSGESCTLGCLLGPTCYLPPQNTLDTSCGGARDFCQDCTLTGEVCTNGVCVGPPLVWRHFYTLRNPAVLTSIATLKPGDVYAAGQATAFVHLAGTVITDTYLGDQSFDLLAVGDAGSATLYLAGGGSYGSILVFQEPWDGGDTPGPSLNLEETTAARTVFKAGDDIYVAGTTFSGNQLQLYKRNPNADGGWVNVTDIVAAGAVDGWGSSPETFSIVTSAAQLLQHSATGWSTPLTLNAMPRAVWGVIGGRVYYVGESDMFGWVEGGGNLSSVPTGRTMGRWFSIWAPDEQNVFFVGTDAECPARVMKWLGTAFDTPVCLDDGGVATAVSGTSARDVWVGLSNGKLFHLSP